MVSDIHGQYELFKKLLEVIDFSDSDVMYILGDIIDKGNKSLKLIDYIRKKENIICILGNHEYEFLKYYDRLTKEYCDKTDEVLKKLQNYFNDDYKLSWDIVDYIDSLPPIIITDRFIGVHAGMEVDKEKRILPLEEQSINHLVYDRHFKDIDIINPFKRPIIIGHTPCFYDNESGEFIKSPNNGSKNIYDYYKIRIDSGVVYTNMLGALRLEDMKEIYVSNKIAIQSNNQKWAS